MAYFINDKCVGCTACETVCPVTAISGVKKEFYFIDPKICVDCGACGRACPYDAIFDTYGNTAEKVRRTGVPYCFPPMNSRERRLMHMACKGLEGVETASSGEGMQRFLVVYPEGKTDMPVKPPVQPRGFGRR